MVKGRTRTVTEIEDAPPAALIVVYVDVLIAVLCPNRSVSKKGRYNSGKWYTIMNGVCNSLSKKPV